MRNNAAAHIKVYQWSMHRGNTYSLTILVRNTRPITATSHKPNMIFLFSAHHIIIPCYCKVALLQGKCSRHSCSAHRQGHSYTIHAIIQHVFTGQCSINFSLNILLPMVCDNHKRILCTEFIIINTNMTAFNTHSKNLTSY